MIGRDSHGPRNDPTCKLRNNPLHVCHDKFGQVWDRENVGPRPGTRCASAVGIDQATDQLQAELDDDKSVLMRQLGALLASTMDDPDDDDECGMVLG